VIGKEWSTLRLRRRRFGDAVEEKRTTGPEQPPRRSKERGKVEPSQNRNRKSGDGYPRVSRLKISRLVRTAPRVVSDPLNAVTSDASA